MWMKHLDLMLMLESGSGCHHLSEKVFVALAYSLQKRYLHMIFDSGNDLKSEEMPKI